MEVVSCRKGSARISALKSAKISEKKIGSFTQISADENSRRSSQIKIWENQRLKSANISEKKNEAGEVHAD